MTKRATAIDERQTALPIDLPPAPPASSDLRARDEILIMLDTLEAAKSPPWSLRLLEWQRRRLAALSQLLTPLEAAALNAKFVAELERLGPPQD